MALIQTGKNYENLVVSSADVDLYLTLAGVPPIQLFTGVQLQVTVSQDVSEVHAISQVDPIALKRATRRYTGTFSIQNGEYEQNILNAVNGTALYAATPIASLLELRSFTLSWKMYMGTDVAPISYMYALNNCMLSSQDLSIERNSVETTISFNLTATGLTRTPLI